MSGATYEARSIAEQVPAPSHPMTQQEATKLKTLELAFTKFAHKLGIRVHLKMRFPEEP